MTSFSFRSFGYGALMIRAMANYIITSFVVEFICFVMIMEHKDPTMGTNYTFFNLLVAIRYFLSLNSYV